MLEANDGADQSDAASLNNNSDVPDFIFRYTFGYPYRNTGRLRLAAFQYEPDNAGIDLAPMFRKAGQRYLDLHNVADITSQIETWLEHGYFDPDAMGAAYARAIVDFEQIQPILRDALESEILAPDLDNEPSAVTALRFAPRLAEIMLQWDEFGLLYNDAWRQDLAKTTAKLIELVEEAEPRERSSRCRTFPYHQSSP